MSHAHEKVVCSCGELIMQCRCIEGGQNVRTVERGCHKCSPGPFTQLISPQAVAAIQEAMLTDIYRRVTPIPGGQFLKPWQDADTSGDQVAYQTTRVPQRRAIDLCTCGHSTSIHRDGVGACQWLGEPVGGFERECTCQRFTPHPQPRAA